jgi:DNA-binding MarR family transcriptional regulator
LVHETSHRPGRRYQVLIQLLRTAETLWLSSRMLFARWNLSPSQFNVLNLLHGLPEGLSQIELSRALLMHRSNVTGLVDRLEARGLVQRQTVPDDRRSYRVTLTAAGLRLMQQILPLYYRAAEEVWGDVPDGQASRLGNTLDGLCANARRLANTLAKAGGDGGAPRKEDALP